MQLAAISISKFNLIANFNFVKQIDLVAQLPKIYEETEK